MTIDGNVDSPPMSMKITKDKARASPTASSLPYDLANIFCAGGWHADLDPAADGEESAILEAGIRGKSEVSLRGSGGAGTDLHAGEAQAGQVRRVKLMVASLQDTKWLLSFANQPS